VEKEARNGKKEGAKRPRRDEKRVIWGELGWEMGQRSGKRAKFGRIGRDFFFGSFFYC